MIQLNITVEWMIEYSCVAPTGRQHPEGLYKYTVLYDAVYLL